MVNCSPEVDIVNNVSTTKYLNCEKIIEVINQTTLSKFVRPQLIKSN